MLHVMAPILLLAAAALTYANSLANPFLFDDLPAIVGNADIRQIWPPVWLDSSFHGSLSSRPLVMLSLALNYTVNGVDPFSFRLVNLVLHLGCGLLLYAVMLLLLRSSAQQARYGTHAPALAFTCALLWLLHPLQSQCINYVIQRSEILMTLCCLATLYATQRSLIDKPWWSILAVLACMLGMTSKESMAGVPLLVPLCDRAMSGNIQVWRHRFGLYISLAATWLLLFWLLADRPHRTTIGFDQGISAWTYAINQCQAIVGYLRLYFWPNPLVFDYGYPNSDLTLFAIWPQALVLLALLGGSAWLLYRHPAAGFAAATFFVLLAPTSSFIPIINEVAAERRMYLPLAALIGLSCCAIYTVCAHNKRYLQIAVSTAFCAALALGLTTAERNRDYQSSISIWRTAVAAVPDNPRAQVNLAVELMAAGDLDGAQTHYMQALELAPHHADAHNNLGIVLTRRGKWNQALDHYRQAIQFKPGFFEAHNNLGIALAHQQRWQEAQDHYRQAIQFKPAYAKAHNNLGMALVATQHVEEAIAHFRQAIQAAPEYARPHNQLGLLLEDLGDLDGALFHYQHATKLAPDFAEAHNNLGIVLEMRGQRQKAIEHYLRAIAIEPDNFFAHYNLGLAYQSAGASEQAIEYFHRAVALDSTSVEARQNLAAAIAAHAGL